MFLEEAHPDVPDSASALAASDLAPLRSQTVRSLDEASRLIAALLPPEACPPSPPTKRKAAAIVDAQRHPKRNKTLPQPPGFHDLTEAFSSHIAQGTFGDGGFLSGVRWPVGMQMTFRPDWYSGLPQPFLLPLPPVDPAALLQVGGSRVALRGWPSALDKTATLVRNSLACSGFLELATQAVLKCLEDTWDLATSTPLQNIHTILVAANRAAYHASANDMAAATNCDLWRRDCVLHLCADLPKTIKAQLRRAPVGGPLLFGSTWQAVQEASKDLWPRPASAPSASHFRAPRRARGRALRAAGPATRPPFGGRGRARPPPPARQAPGQPASSAWPRRARGGARGRAR